MEIGVTMECPTHGVMEIAGKTPSDGVDHYHLTCGCTFELSRKDPIMEDSHVAVGDVVLWNGDLFRLDDIKVEGDEVWACILNTDGDEEVPISYLEYVGEDKLTGVGMKGFMNNFTTKTDVVPEGSKQSWSPPPYERGKTQYSPPLASKKSTRKIPHSGAPKRGKGLAISTHGLIKHEVNELKKSPSNVVPFKSSDADEKSEGVGNKKSKGIPKRRGDW